MCRGQGAEQLTREVALQGAHDSLRLTPQVPSAAVLIGAIPLDIGLGGSMHRDLLLPAR